MLPCKLQCCYMTSSLNRDSGFRLYIFLFPKAISGELCLSSLQLVFSTVLAAVKRLKILHRSAILFYFIWDQVIHESLSILVSWKIESCLRLKPVLVGTYEALQLLMLSDEGPAKKFCHWVRITLELRFIKHIFIANLQSIPPLLKHIFVTFLRSREKQINSLLLVSAGDTDK